jgi:hypothetical protein
LGQFSSLGFGSGTIFKNNSVENTAYTFVLLQQFCLRVIQTGEGAEEMVEDFPTVEKL